jgi:hypothetical protein
VNKTLSGVRPGQRSPRELLIHAHLHFLAFPPSSSLLHLPSFIFPHRHHVKAPGRQRRGGRPQARKDVSTSHPHRTR